MLDGLLGRGFASKCKSLIKLIKNRIDVIRRKRNATQKFLKKDIADLLANGLDINAYGRADGLLAELNVSYCYDLIEQCCDFVTKSVSVMQKVSSCPVDCREVVASLMFAAARFSDLPELRDLRQIFQERYGNSLEHFVNKEFVEKLSSKPATMDKKVQLMQDIASEYSINWDSQAFQQRMSKPSASVQDQPKSCSSFTVTNDKYKPINGKHNLPTEPKYDVSHKGRIESASDGYRLRNGKEGNVLNRNELIFQPRQVSSSNGLKPLDGREESILKMGDHGISRQGKQEVIGDKHEVWNGNEDAILKMVKGDSSTHGKRMEYIDSTVKPQGGRENAVPKRESKDSSPYGKPFIAPSYTGQHLKSDGKGLLDSDSCGGQHNTTNLRKVQEEEITKLKTYYNNALPPPYVKSKDRTVKSKDSKYGANLGSSHLRFDGNGVPKDPSVPEREAVGTPRVNSHDDEIDHHYKDDGAGNAIPKPRSVRRRHNKSASGHDNTGNGGDVEVVKRKSRSRRDDTRRGLQILFDDEQYQNDEEERKMDKLLMYYSTKPSTHEHGLLRRKSKSRHAHHGVSDAGEAPPTLCKDVSDEVSDTVPPPVRSISLPHGQTSSESKKVFARAASFQPDRSNEARHVHPKLPDYDDLAARFAALKGR
ncbi:IST1-like protein [Melia azedarach]|nr:IST1-like protein [Melia azedarach]